MRALVILAVVAACSDGSDSAASAGSSSGHANPPGVDDGKDAGSGGGSGGGDASVEGGAPRAKGYVSAFKADPVTFDCADSAEAILAKSPAHVTIGTSTVIVGYEQVSGTDQDPLVARFDGGQKVFCEHSKKGGGIDARAYGVTWDGGAHLYVVYTVVGGGTQFDAAAKNGWIRSYGDGGASAKVTVIGALDATTGVVNQATYVVSRLIKSGQPKTNTLVPADAVHVLDDGSVEFLGKPAYCTLNPDLSLMCDAAVTSDYPKDYRARFTADLTQMTCASATGVSRVAKPCPP